MDSTSNTFSFTKLLSGQEEVSSLPANIALLLLRFFAGFTIMTAGLDKLPNKDWMIEQVTSIGFPLPVLFAWIASFSEFAFGAMLILGILTRLSGFMLAFTLGVAAFGFHKVTPLLSMHITQYFFWIFFLFTFLGAGKFSLDYLINKTPISSFSRLLKVGVPIFMILLSIGLYKEYFTQEVIVQEEVIISSINVPGSFNEWNPAANEMEKLNATDYKLKVDFEKTGFIEFKFTTNKSWDTNFGDDGQLSKGFPISGKAQVDEGNDVNNIRAYIPKPGSYEILLNSETFVYSLDSLRR